MDILHMLGDFLLSAWLWNVTFDWFHPFFTGIILFLMFRVIMRKKRIKSFLVSFGAQLTAFVILNLIVVYGLMGALHWQYELIYERYPILNELSASLSVGIVYAIFQSLYFVFGKALWEFNLFAYLIMTWISNGIGMLLSYFFIRLVIMCQYAS